MRRVLKWGLLIVVLVGLYVVLSEDKERPTEVVMSLVEMRSEAKPVTYDDLARYPDKNKGVPVVYRGRIAQKVNDTAYRIHTTQGEYNLWTDTVYVRLRGDARGARLLEDDIVDFIGLAQGEYSYRAVLGNRVTIPQIDVYEITLVANSTQQEGF